MRYLIAAALLATSVAGFAATADAAAGMWSRLSPRPVWRLPAQSRRGRGAAATRRGGAAAGRVPDGSRRGGTSRPCLPPRHGLVCRTLPLLSLRHPSRQKPRSRGVFCLADCPSGGPTSTRQREDGHPALPRTGSIALTSNGGASSGGGGASGGESPSDGGGANPDDASPSPACPIPGDDRGPSAPDRAKDDRPRRRS